MLQNASFVAIVAVHTAEIEPSKVGGGGGSASSRDRAAVAEHAEFPHELEAVELRGHLEGCVPDETAQTLRGSFSAVSTATIATKGSFCSVFQNLQDLH